MHNLIHNDFGGQSERCPVCNGQMKMSDTAGMTKMCSDILSKRQGRMYSESAGIHIEGSNGKKSRITTAFEFAEKVEAMPKEIMLVPTGKWDTTKYGEVEVKKTDIEQMKVNFDENVRKGVMIDIEHRQNATYGEQAAGWIKAVEVRPDGLWATEIDWNPLGTQLVKDKIYKFLSPEFDVVHIDPENSSKMSENVLIATTLCNRPLLKEIPSLSMSEEKNLTPNPNGVILFIEPDTSTDEKGSTMNFADVLKKLMAGESISADEKAVLEANKAEMTDEQKTKAGFKIEAAEDRKDKTLEGKESITISAAEATQLREDAAKGRQAFAEMEKTKVDAEIRSFQFSENGKGGKMSKGATDKAVAFALKLDPAMRVEFTEILKELPDKKLFGESGSDGSVTTNQSRDALTEEVKKYAKDNSLKFTEALAKMQAVEPEKFTNYQKSFSEQE